jgi:two-component system response regulator NreC
MVMRGDSGGGSSGGIRFAMVGDHEFTRLGVRVFLQRHRGWQVIAEASGDEALEKCGHLTPDVIILDIRMPEGVEVIQRLRTRCPQAALLMLSAYSDEQSVHAALSAGVRAYVLKTGSTKELSVAVTAVRNGAHYISPSVSELIIRNYALRTTPPQESKPEELSAREREVLQLLANGKSTKEIADTLRISGRTVEGHRSHLMKKLRARTSSELVRYALRSGIAD